MAVDGAEINGATRPAAGAEHVEPWRSGEQRSPDRLRPQHVAKGHDIRAIQAWLGHRSITSTAIYTAGARTGSRTSRGIDLMARRYGTGRRRSRRRRHVSDGPVGSGVVVRQHSRNEHRDDANYYPSANPDGSNVLGWGINRLSGE